MRTPRLIAGLVTAGLLGITPLAITAPAQAAPVTATLTWSDTADALEDGIVAYGEDVSLTGNVADPATGSNVTVGTVSLQVLTAANPVWTEVAVDDYAGSFSFYDVKPEQNSQYKVVYSGGTASSGAVFDPTESAPTTVGVSRAIKAKTPGLRVVGKVSPDYKKGKIQVLRKVGKKFKPFKTVKTNKKSRFSVKLPTGKRGKKLFFALAIKGDDSFAPTYDVYYTIRY